jgi:hypothetical protein
MSKDNAHSGLPSLAKALGLTIPAKLLPTAYEVIE